MATAPGPFGGESFHYILRGCWGFSGEGIVYTPKHGSWMNIAEIELNVLTRQCLCRRIGDGPALIAEVGAWEIRRNESQAGVDWQFTTADARVKLKRLYPRIQS